MLFELKIQVHARKRGKRTQKISIQLKACLYLGSHYWNTRTVTEPDNSHTDRSDISFLGEKIWYSNEGSSAQ